MGNSKGSILLKALSADADLDQLTEYLGKRAKSIPPEKIPDLLNNLPVVLSRNVPEDVGRFVVQRLGVLGAEALYLPALAGEEGSLGRAVEQLQGGQPAREAEAAKPSSIRRSFRRFGLEGALIASMLAIAWMLNYTLASRYLLLGFYSLPAVLSAYYFGRRQAVFTAFAGILLVSIVSLLSPGRFDLANPAGLGGENQWYHIVSWGCILLVTAYTMGTLYERDKNKMHELRQTYQGLLLILRHFIAQDEVAENHCFRVSIYASRIAENMGMEKDEVEDIRTAALLHDLGKLSISRAILEKAARFNLEQNRSGRRSDPDPLSGSTGRILPILIGHDSQGQAKDSSADPKQPADILRGTRVLLVADAYDLLTAAPPAGRGLSPDEAKEVILADRGFDPEVVKAFAKACVRAEMELPSIIL